MSAAVVVAVVAFVAMEPAAYAAHRWVMHGVGWVLHRSHHRRRAAAFEANDLFPVAFAAVTVLALLAGVEVHRLHLLVAGGVGVTAYGAVYSFVHDVYIHGRLGRLPVLGPLERLRRAHAVHHLYGGEPYGMLCPVVPRALRERAGRAGRDPLVARRSAARA